MPHGKPAGMRCAQLAADNRCLIFGRPERPAVCAQLMPSAEMCGDGQAQALHYLTQLEILTQPSFQRKRESRADGLASNGSPPSRG